MSDLELPRGMKDFDSDSLSNIELIREQFLKTCNIFGFDQMEPTPIELLSVLEAKSGTTIKDEIYYFKDKGDREVALRFDFTVGLTRYVSSQKSLKLPAKLCSFGGVWRYDEPQKGRYRFFNQWDIEIYGKPSIESESEVIEFTSRIFEALKFNNIIIDLNHRKLVESYINKIFNSSDEHLMADILRAVDKIQKKSKDEIIKEFQEKGYSKENLEKILDFSKIKGTPEEIEQNFDVSQLDNWNDLKNLWDSLQNRNVSNIRINFGIVRGLDYYSGTVFEVYDTTSSLGALAGGGRYDSLTKVFGRDDIGATGVAGGVERMILTMEEQKIIQKKPENKITVLYVNDDMIKPAMNIASKLRQSEIPTEIDLVGRQFKKQMESSTNSNYVIIVGPKEFLENSVVLKDMKSGNENIITIEKLLSDAKTILNS